VFQEGSDLRPEKADAGGTIVVAPDHLRTRVDRGQGTGIETETGTGTEKGTHTETERETLIRTGK